MKSLKSILLCCLSLIFIESTCAAGALLKPCFDERSELLSIVFRLAGAAEYSGNTTVKSYTDKVDDYFKPYASHEVVKLAALTRKKNGVSYDAVMSMAIHLEIRNDSVRFVSDVLENSLDKRWGDFSTKFVLLLDDFYRKTKFSEFFESNRDLYTIVESRFSSISDKIDVNWFPAFSGVNYLTNFHVVLSMINAGNYGPSVLFRDGKTDVYSIICAWDADSSGIPVFPESIIGTLIHEMSHSFCNPAGEKYFPEMQSVAQKFYEINNEKFRMQAYGYASTIVNEILVRASVIKYFQDHDSTSAKIDELIMIEQGMGFLWIDKLVELFDDYEQNRATYPTLESFMPEVVKLQNSLNPETLSRELSVNFPQIISFSIPENSSQVDPATAEIVIVFDRPMISFGASYGKGGKKHYPEILSYRWGDENKSIVVLNVQLEPEKRYSMKFVNAFNVDKHGFWMEKTKYLNFRTTRKQRLK